MQWTRVAYYASSRITLGVCIIAYSKGKNMQGVVEILYQLYQNMCTVS